MSHILLDSSFLLFWSILVEILREHFFLDIKVTISETSTEIHRNFFFLPCLKGSNPEDNLDLFKQLFSIKPLKRINIKKTVFLHKVCHILLNYVNLLFWCNFGGIQNELFFSVKKVSLSETKLEILKMFVFLTLFERGISWEKLGFG